MESALLTGCGVFLLARFGRRGAATGRRHTSEVREERVRHVGGILPTWRGDQRIIFRVLTLFVSTMQMYDIF